MAKKEFANPFFAYLDLLHFMVTRVLTYNFAVAITVYSTIHLKTLATKLQLVSQLQNCELKQEPCTLATELHQPLKFHNRERKYFFAFAGLVWNCPQIATSGRTFVLTLNLASALKVSDNEIHFLLPQNIVVTTNSIGLESKPTTLKVSDNEIHFLLPQIIVATTNSIGLESKPTTLKIVS